MAKQPQRRPAPQPQSQQRKTVPAAPARRAEKRESLFSAGREVFVFGRMNFILFGVGLGLVILGLLTMSGGSMPDPNTWDPNVIYSFRRITLAPILMLSGFAVVIYGIFRKDSAPASESDNPPTA